jgi:leucyl aminopeptidase (aminopeptidase T)
MNVENKLHALADPNMIRNAVIKMFEVNFSIQPAERVLVLTDFPDENLLRSLQPQEMEAQLQRSMLARWVCEIGKTAFPQNNFEFLPYRATGLNGKEPPEKVVEGLMGADIAAAITSYSLTHTRVRNDATDRGVRIASMPGFMVDMFYPGGAMDADYRMIAKTTHDIQRRLEGVSTVKVSNRQGTNLEFNIKDRKKFARNRFD